MTDTLGMAHGFDEYFQATIRHELGDETLERVLPATVIEVNAPAHQLHLSLLGHDIGWVKYGLGQANPGDTVALHETFDGDRWVKLPPTGVAWCKLWTTDLDFDAGTFDKGLQYPARADQGDKTGQLQCKTTEIYGDGRDGDLTLAAGQTYQLDAQAPGQSWWVTTYGGKTVDVHGNDPSVYLQPGDKLLMMCFQVRIHHTGTIIAMVPLVGLHCELTMSDQPIGSFGDGVHWNFQVNETIPFLGNPGVDTIVNIQRVPQWRDVLMGFSSSTITAGAYDPNTFSAGLVAFCASGSVIGAGQIVAGGLGYRPGGTNADCGSSTGYTGYTGEGLLQNDPTNLRSDTRGGGFGGWNDGCIPSGGNPAAYYVGSGGGGGGSLNPGTDGESSSGGGPRPNIGESGGGGGPGYSGAGPSQTPEKWFLGGGGGAGGLNTGARGGGIVYVNTPLCSVATDASGFQPPPTGGGGGGGTIKMTTTSPYTAASTHAGGLGGFGINGLQYRIGAGGAGSDGSALIDQLGAMPTCWTSDVLTSASLGLTPNLPITPGTFKADWQLDADLLVPSFTLQSSPTGAWAGEQTAYPLATVGHNGEWVQVNLPAALYWRVVACLQVGSDLTNTPYVFDIELCGRA